MSAPTAGRASTRKLAAWRSKLPRWATKTPSIVAMSIIAIMVIASVFADQVAPFGARDIVGAPLQGIGAQHLLGTDEIGRDIFSRLVYGARVSVGIGFAAAAVALLVGAPWGVLSGYFGGWLDTVSMRLVDGILAFPGILLALSIIAALGPGIRNLIIALAISQVARFARLLRGEVLSVRERDYVKAARVIGASDYRIMAKAIVPTIMPLVLVQFSLSYAASVLSETGLSFVGLGVSPPDPSWGNMLSSAKNYIDTTWVYGIAPGFAIFLLVLALGILGDDITDSMEKRARM